MTPGLLAVLAPVIAGFFLKAEALGAFLAGSILTGQLLAVMLSNSGGAWDNAKKYIEEGHYGGKNSESHKAAVIGDTVGDPFKDTSSVAMNPIIKFTTLFGLLAVELAVSLASSRGVQLTLVLAAVFFLGALYFVYRSFYGMRIESETPAEIPTATPERVPAR
jgi:K(+)-stimulated pyrophosphate-energized sodium pump